MKHRRLLLGSLALAAIAAPPITAGCAADFAPISQLQGLRVLAVVPEDDRSYVAPCAADPTAPGCSPGDDPLLLPAGTSVTFDMSYEFTYTNEVVLNDGGPVQIADNPVQIVWVGGCVNPAGDEYYGCYPQFASLFAELGPYFQSHNVADIPPSALANLGFGASFPMSLPRDLISSRQAQPGLPHYGIAFAFFLVCAGDLGPAADGASAGGLAGNFPVGCYDHTTHLPVGADRFVPGYTQVYAFGAGYTNNNPPVCGLSVTPTGGAGGGTGDDGTCVPDPLNVGSGPQVTSAAYCDVSTAARSGSGCGKTDAFSACTTYDVIVEVPDTVADFDPSSGVYETVWVDYFADQGDIDTPTLLVSDSASPTQGPDAGIYPPSPGLQAGKFVARWSPPPPPEADAGADAGDAGVPSETATIWAVVHDSRGGSTVTSKTITLSVDGGS